SIAATEDRKRMAGVCERLGIPTPAWTIAHSRDELEEFAPRLGFPVLVRPSYVLGGRGMKIVRDLGELRAYLGDLAPHLRERTVPFASKAGGVPLARLATRLILGDSLSDLEINPGGQGQVSVKAVVLPFDKFPSLDRTLGPEMQSTGERMGIAPTYAEALAKAGYASTD